MKKTITLILGFVLFLFGAFLIYTIARRSFDDNKQISEITNGENQFKKGVSLLISKKLPQAKEALEISYDLGYNKAAAPLGACYLQMGNMKEAAKYLNEAVENISDFNKENQRVIYNQLGIVFSKQEDYKNAKKYWQKAAKLGSLDAEKNLERNR